MHARRAKTCLGFAIIFAFSFCGSSHAFQDETTQNNAPRTYDLSAAKDDFRTGKYQQSLSASAIAVEDGVWNEDWYHLKIDNEMILGKYEDAKATFEAGLTKYPNSILLRWRGFHVLQLNNDPATGLEILNSIDPTVRKNTWRYTDSSNRVIIGLFMSELGLDPKQILSTFYDAAKKNNPRNTDAYIAAAELALSKHDYQLAGTEIQAALKIDEDDPQLHYLYACAFAPSDPEKADAGLAKALEINQNHLPSLLWKVDMAINAEQHDDALEQLKKISIINPRLPELWAYRAVISHLKGDFESEKQLRTKALEPWETNPEVDYLIGKKLAEKYRFAEAATYQRQALEFDPDFTEAKFELSQNLLRIGEEEQGWSLADEVYANDKYNVVAHNLVTLHDEIKKFVSLERDGIIVRMGAFEAELYGERALQLFSRAKEVLGERYDAEFDRPIIVEIYPAQKDFAIRTFGLPGGEGFLGVCFGRLITMNSPAALGSHLSSWEATAWHEFCHVVTLEKTKNRMPRWLSEGISVYEERRENPAWGQSMNASYREMITSGEMHPVSELSQAFLRPKSSLHLQFAYYQSSLAVEFLVDEFGLETLQRVLTDLSVGMPINESLQRYVGSLAEFNQRFESYARTMAEQYGGEADWSEPNVAENASEAVVKDWLRNHSNNIAALRMLANLQINDNNWEQGAETLEQVVAFFHPEMIATVSSGESALPVEAGEDKTDDDKGESNKADFFSSPSTPDDQGPSGGSGSGRSANDDSDKLGGAGSEGYPSFGGENGSPQNPYGEKQNVDEQDGAAEEKTEGNGAEQEPSPIPTFQFTDEEKLRHRTGDGSPGDLALLARAYRELGELKKEQQILGQLVAYSADVMPAYERLASFAEAEGDWQRVYNYSQNMLAIDPLQPAPHLLAAESAQQLNQVNEAIVAFRALLQFRTTDLANANYQLARLHQEREDWDSANSHVLKAIESAPRFRDAYKLYLEIRRHREQTSQTRDRNIADDHPNK